MTDLRTTIDELRRLRIGAIDQVMGLAPSGPAVDKYLDALARHATALLDAAERSLTLEAECERLRCELAHANGMIKGMTEGGSCE